MAITASSTTQHSSSPHSILSASNQQKYTVLSLFLQPLILMSQMPRVSPPLARLNWLLTTQHRVELWLTPHLHQWNLWVRGHWTCESFHHISQMKPTLISSQLCQRNQPTINWQRKIVRHQSTSEIHLSRKDQIPLSEFKEASRSVSRSSQVATASPMFMVSRSMLRSLTMRWFYVVNWRGIMVMVLAIELRSADGWGLMMSQRLASCEESRDGSFWCLRNFRWRGSVSNCGFVACVWCSELLARSRRGEGVYLRALIERLWSIVP